MLLLDYMNFNLIRHRCPAIDDNKQFFSDSKYYESCFNHNGICY